MRFDLTSRTHSPASCDQPGCLCEEPIDVGQHLVPQVDGDVHDVGHQAEGRQRGVQEERVKAAAVGVV